MNFFVVYYVKQLTLVASFSAMSTSKGSMPNALSTARGPDSLRVPKADAPLSGGYEQRVSRLCEFRMWKKSIPKTRRAFVHSGGLPLQFHNGSLNLIGQRHCKGSCCWTKCIFSMCPWSSSLFAKRQYWFSLKW